ncbi:MAG: hypothetical protein U1F77_12235 [Kiritimatiellia bacterium]
MADPVLGVEAGAGLAGWQGGERPAPSGACRSSSRRSITGTPGSTTASVGKSGTAHPLKDAVRITEASLLAVKATRYPGQELLWDKAKLAFTNHAEATNTIVRRAYRDGFAPPKFG